MCAPDWLPSRCAIWSVFLVYNLVFVCLLAESFFRGILQTALIKALGRLWQPPLAALFGVLSASVLFGLAHIAGGPAYMLLAALVGISYGAAYYLTGRLSMAGWVHFAVNAGHRLAFAG
jgi:membrane protease YdiL (CAAX protease family)